MRQFYIKEFKKVLPVILSSQDSHGFFTKSKNARWQEAVLSLLLFDKNKFRERILKGIDAWSKLQNRDGSLPEHVKKSYAATAFSLYAVVRCLNELEERKYVKNIESACRYLCSKKNIETPNQEAVAGLALIEASNILGVYKGEGVKKIKHVLKVQNKEGWFPEYGGPDIGYNSLTLEVLGLVYLENILKNKIRHSAKMFINWVKYFIFPNGSLGGSYNTRTGGWLILDAFEIFKNRFPTAGAIIGKHINGHRKKSFKATHLIDNRHIMTDSWRLISAYKNSRVNIKKSKLPCENENWDKLFEKSKLFVFRRPDYMGILSANEIARSGLTLWRKNNILIDLNNKNPNLMKTTLQVNNNKIEITGYRYSGKVKRISRKIKLWGKFRRVLKNPILKYKILYRLSEKVSINSNKPLTLSGFAISGTKEGIEHKNNIFFNRKYIRTKRGTQFEV